jgi:hypothetical protein
MIFSDTGADFEPIPSGVHRAVCVNVFDIGYQRNLDGHPVRQCVILWELEAVKKDGQPFTVTRRLTASLNEKATLRGLLESWRGRPFTVEELKRFDSTNLLGINCRLNLVEKIKTGGKRTVEVESVLRPEGNPTAIRAVTPRDFIPGWVQKCIQEQLPAPNSAAPSSADIPGSPDDGIVF